jgi:primary-amine oxidase
MEKSEEGGYHPRKDVKPLHVVQPEGVSFKMDGHVLEWQNWKMHIGKFIPTLPNGSSILTYPNSIYPSGGHCYIHNHV